MEFTTDELTYIRWSLEDAAAKYNDLGNDKMATIHYELATRFKEEWKRRGGERGE